MTLVRVSFHRPQEFPADLSFMRIGMSCISTAIIQANRYLGPPENEIFFGGRKNQDFLYIKYMSAS